TSSIRRYLPKTRRCARDERRPRYSRRVQCWTTYVRALLDPNSFEIRNIYCPHYGIAPLMAGKEDQTGQERVFCLKCENIIH
ncbi:MAG: hypothetical protein ACFFC7_11495, partial [Candidatus Hermodarchaeota archaeon]